MPMQTLKCAWCGMSHYRLWRNEVREYTVDLAPQVSTRFPTVHLHSYCAKELLQCAEEFGPVDSPMFVEIRPNWGHYA